MSSTLGAVATSLVVLLGSVLGPAATTQAAALPPYHPSRLSHLGNAHQVVIVTSPGWASSTATLRAYRQDRDGEWRLRLGPWRARVGWNGMVRAGERRQGSGTTPAGTFGLDRGFGSLPDPGTGLSRYRHYDKNDYWVYDPRDPRTYNVLQPNHGPGSAWRRSWAERLMEWGGHQYTYGVVINYNLPRGVRWSKRHRQYVARRPADTRRGGGIFLHVNGSGATAGCVSVSKPRMRRLLRWLDADRDPRIVIGPRHAITRM